MAKMIRVCTNIRVMQHGTSNCASKTAEGFPEKGVREKPRNSLVFFFGAGSSVELGVPDTHGFVRLLFNNLKSKDRVLYEVLLDIFKKEGWDSKNPEKQDIEQVLQLLETLLSPAFRKSSAFFSNGRYVYQKQQTKIKNLISFVQDTIYKKALVGTTRAVHETVKNHLEPLTQFIDDEDYYPVEIFTTNYDTAIEKFCSEHRKRLCDGFEIYWNNKLFDEERYDVKLYKLHGSVTWFKTDHETYMKSLIIRERPKITLITKEEAESLILYPIQKWQYAEPILDNLVTLKKKLCEATYVVVVGYSFRDDYIKNIFWDAANKNKKMLLLLISPDAGRVFETQLKTYPSGINSSLCERVICLPFKFGDVFPYLKVGYIKEIDKATASERTLREMDIKNIPDRPEQFRLHLIEDALIHYCNCGHIDKADDLLSEYYGGLRTHDLFEQLVNLSLMFAYHEKNQYRTLQRDLIYKLSSLFEHILDHLDLVVDTHNQKIEVYFNIRGSKYNIISFQENFSRLVENSLWALEWHVMDVHEGWAEPTRLRKYILAMQDFINYLCVFSQPLPYEKYVIYSTEFDKREVKDIIDFLKKDSSDKTLKLTRQKLLTIEKTVLTKKMPSLKDIDQKFNLKYVSREMAKWTASKVTEEVEKHTCGRTFL